MNTGIDAGYSVVKALLWRVVGFFWHKPETYGHCPHCNFEDFDPYEEPWFECTNGGLLSAPGEPTDYWFVGLQTCPRCQYIWEISG